MSKDNGFIEINLNYIETGSIGDGSDSAEEEVEEVEKEEQELMDRSEVESVVSLPNASKKKMSSSQKRHSFTTPSGISFLKPYTKSNFDSTESLMKGKMKSLHRRLSRNSTDRRSSTSISIDSMSIVSKDDTKPKKTDLKVSFSNIEIRQYERILGDNPGVTDGPSLAIGWNYYPERTVSASVKEYEKFKSSIRERDVLLTRAAREKILIMDLGYSEKEIAESIRSIMKIKQQRNTTANNIGIAKIEEKFEKLFKLKKLF